MAAKNKPKSKMSREDRELAEKVVELLERVKMMIWDPETPPEKLAELERVTRRCHALYFRGRM